MTKSRSFRPRDDEQEKAIEEHMYEKGLNWADAMRNLLDKALNMENRYEALDDSCPALTMQGNYFVCVWARVGQPPLIKKLGKTLDDAKPICNSCKKTLDIKVIQKENKKLHKQIDAIPIHQTPKCLAGGHLFQNDTRMSCPTALGNRRPVLQKNRQKNDLPPCTAADEGNVCEHLRWITAKMDGSNL